MNNQSVSKAKHLPHDLTMGALLVVLLASAFLIVLPRLHYLRALPQHYYNLLPVATQSGDVDRDGIADNIDPTPYGHRTKGVGKRVGPNAIAEEVVTGTGDVLAVGTGDVLAVADADGEGGGEGADEEADKASAAE